MTDDATQEREAVSELERLSHTHGPIVVDWMGEQLGWCPLSEVDGGSWETFSQPQTDALKKAREALEAAPLIGRTENVNDFMARQNAWLNGPYRAALEQSK